MSSANQKEEKVNDDAPEEELTQSVILELSNQLGLLQLSNDLVPVSEKDSFKTNILTQVEALNMAPYYQHVCTTLNLDVDQALFTTMQSANVAEIKSFDEKEIDAKENHGETEVREVQIARADYYAKIGDKKKSIDSYEELLKTTVGAGAKIDLVFAQLRVGFVWNDRKLLKEKIAQAKGLVEKGGDWERRNRYGVYTATYLMLTKQFKAAAELFLKATATFTCSELYSYNQFVFYTVFCAMVSLDRVTIRDKVNYILIS